MDKYERRRLRLIELIDTYCEGKNSKLASITGIDASYISRMRYEAGKKGKKNIGEDTIETILKAFRLPDSWFDFPPGTIYSGQLVEGLEQYVPPLKGGTHRPSQENTVFIYQYDTGGKMGSAGLVLQDQPGEILSWTVTKEWIRSNIKGHVSPQDLCIVTGFGDSMRPDFNPGDPLLIDRSVTTVDHDGFYFFRVGNEGFIKRIQRVPGVGMRAISSNPAYEPWTITADMDFAVLGKVVRVWKGEYY